MSKFFTSDWHLDDSYTRGSHTFFRPKPTATLVPIWLDECHQLIQPDDELWLLGDMANCLETYRLLDALPDCKLNIMLGNREDKIPNFADEVLNYLPKHQSRAEVLGTSSRETQYASLNTRVWRISHQPENLLGYSLAVPALCGHVHGTWRTQQLPGGEPIINVGIDAWHRIVTEEHIEHERHAIKKGYYGRNVCAVQWNSPKAK